MASSGSIALAAWRDGRAREMDVLASRVDVNGTPLDPAGIVIRERAALDDVFWDGTDFVVITSRTAEDHELAFVGVDGVIRKRVSLPVAQSYAAHTYEGAASRLLFLPHDGYSPLATIADLRGTILRQGTDDAGTTASWSASNGTQFLVIRRGSAFTAEVIDRNGAVINSIDPHLPPGFSPTSLSGDGRGGYVLAGYTKSSDVTLMHLDAEGLVRGTPAVLGTVNPFVVPSGFSAASATMTSDGFVVTWKYGEVKTNRYSDYISRDGGPAVEGYRSTGRISDVAYDPDADLVFTSTTDLLSSNGYEVWVRKGNAFPHPLTESAEDQSQARVAAGANGFLAAWNDLKQAGRVTFVRRFSASGEPLGEPAFLTGNWDGFSPKIASSGEVYLVTGGSWARRMNARSGEWLDADVFPLNALAIASNGKDALALMVETHGNSVSMEARRVAMTGAPLVFDPILLPVSVVSRPVLASNGQDYLVVWSESQCGIDCPVPSNRILAMRLAADGSLIDRAPIALTDFNGSVANPSVAWNGTNYLVGWQDHGLAGAFLSSDGKVQQLGTIADGSYPFVAAAGGKFLLFRSVISDSGDAWDGKVLGDGDWTRIVTHPNLNFFAPSVASNGGYVMLAYERVSEEAGHVSRVFLDPRVFVTRTRAVR